MRQVCVAGLIVASVAASARADEPDWASMPYTSISALEAVNASGAGTFPLDEPIRVRGVILNDSATMLNPAAGAPAFLGGQYQVYVQTIDGGDFGGTAVYMAEKYGNLPFNPPDESYSPAEWNAELDRVTHDPDSDRPFQVGDRVEVRARAPGLYFAGKTNINEQHLKDPEFDFDVILLEADRGLPTPMEITLADVKTAGDAFIFNQTRATGCEHYQGSLVRLHNVHVVEGAWAPNATVTIADGTGRTFPLLLSLGSGFNAYPPPAGDIDVVAIFDQEDGAGTGQTGYRLWITRDYDGNGWIVGGPSGDFDASGEVAGADYNAIADCLRGPGIHPAPAVATIAQCRAAFDFDMDRDIDLHDYATFQQVFGGL